ncbi:MAG: hypothetical protein O3A00_07665 [Planctomycetota bacterium]|nr:hypothetical protein [Planctomycetota bacterium]
MSEKRSKRATESRTWFQGGEWIVSQMGGLSEVKSEAEHEVGRIDFDRWAADFADV